MKWIKKNKLMIIAIIVFTTITIISYKVVKMFFPDGKTAIYGDRLDGKVKVDKDVYEKVKTKISEQEFVKKVTVKENGRIINIDAQVLDSTSVDAAKGISRLILEFFNESQIGYYDFQIFVTKESGEENNFPIIGYKQHNSQEFSWTKDREKTQPETQEEG